MIKVRAFLEDDLEPALDLIRNSNSTDRTKETWLGNNMTAMLAFDNSRLIGIIPFEKRKVVLAGEKHINVLWVSGAYVEPEYRNQSIGTRMDGEVKKYFSHECEAVLVCREDETSPAYRWYKKLGYQPLTPIISFRKDVERLSMGIPEYVIWKTKKEIDESGEKILKCFKGNIGSRGGFSQRYAQFWTNKLETHYYRAFYTYYVLALMREDNIVSYAFLGQTQMKDGVSRFDILEIIGPEDAAVKNKLYSAIMDFANSLKLKEVRIQVVEQDINVAWIKSLGFRERWRTNILGKLLDSSDAFLSIQWHYFHMDYI